MSTMDDLHDSSSIQEIIGENGDQETKMIVDQESVCGVMSNLGGELMDTDESGLLKGQTVVFDDVGNEVSITATDDRAGNTVTAVTGLAQFITSIRPPAIPGAQQQVKVVRPGSVTTKFMPVKKPPAIAPAPSPAASGLVTKAVIMTSSGQQLVISSPVKSGVDHNQKSNTITLGPATGNVVNQGPQQIMLFSPIKQSTGKLVQVRPKPPSTSWTPIEIQSVSQRKNVKPLQIIRLVQTSNSLTHTAQTSGTTKAYTINRMPTMPISSNFSRAQTSTVSSSGSVATTQKILIPASAIKSSPSTGMIQSSSNTMQQAFITNSGGGQVIMLPAHMFQGQGGQSTASSLPSSATQRTSFVPIAPSPLGSQPTIPASQMLAGLNGSKAAQNSIKSEGDANRPRKPCNCTISQCLKLYCDCFAAFSNLLGFTFCDERTKTWSAGIRYSDTKLWSLKRLPCSKDRVIFPNNTAIYIDRPIKAREVILPLNGELNLDEKVGFGLLDKSNDESGSCQGNDMYFIVQEKDWYDPYNWVTTIDHIKFDGASIWNPIPHSDRIPCPFDDVHFPSGFTFRTKLPLVSRTYIKSLTINNKAYDTDLFARFTETQTGKYLFKSFPNKNQLVIDKARGQCSDKTGCSCGNGEDPKVLAQICAHLSASASCPPLVCQDPVTPSGHCCPVCASLIKVTFDPKEFKYLLSENILKTYQAKTSFVDTFAYMSKRGKNQVEIVITDSGQASSGKGNEFAKSLYEYIQEDMKPNSPGIYAIKTISLVSTVRWTSDGSGHSSLLGTLLFLLFLITLLLISASIAVYLYRTDQLPSGALTFVRFHGFDADDDKVELHLGTRSNYELDSELGGGVSDSGGVQLRSEGNESSVTLSTFTIDEEKISFDNPYFKCGPDNEFSRDLVRECRSLTSVDTIDTMTNKSFTEEEEGNQKLDSVSTRLLLLDE